MKIWPDDDVKLIMADVDDELVAIARDIVEHDDAHSHLEIIGLPNADTTNVFGLGGERFRVALFYSQKAAVSQDQKVLGKAGLFPIYDSFLHGITFHIVIAHETWIKFSNEVKAWLVDHELTHCAVDDKGSPYLRKHNIQEFLEIISKHKNNMIGIDQILKAIEGAKGKTHSTERMLFDKKKCNDGSSVRYEQPGEEVKSGEEADAELEEEARDLCDCGEKLEHCPNGCYDIAPEDKDADNPCELCNNSSVLPCKACGLVRGPKR